MAREILHDFPVQHESDSRLKSGVSSAVGRAGAGRRKAQQFRGGPIFSSGGSSAMKKMDLERCRRILLERREQILGRVEKMLSGEIHLDSNDFPDEMDTAVSETNLSLPKNRFSRYHAHL
jgi:hypothetical protein